MSTAQRQIWKGSSFTIERSAGKAPGTVVFRFHGPFTARDMYGTVTPLALSNMLELQSIGKDEPPLLNILDLADVPYMDSAGLGLIVRHYVRCKSRNIRMIIAAAEQRVLDLFVLCKLDGLILTAATVEKAEAL